MTQSSELDNRTENTQDTPASGDGNVFPHEPEPHPRAARTIIAFALIVFAVMMVLLLLRWLTAQEPTSLVVVHGTANQEGFLVQLKTPNGLVIRSMTLARSGNYEVKFHVPSGKYEMSILLGEKMLFRQPIALRESMGLFYDLTTVPGLSTTQPATP